MVYCGSVTENHDVKDYEKSSRAVVVLMKPVVPLISNSSTVGSSRSDIRSSCVTV